MLDVARQKHPEKILAAGEISAIPFHKEFDCIFCFHVIMHQDQEETKAFLNECHQKLGKNGTLIFDYPVKTRKNQFLHRKTGMPETAFQPQRFCSFQRAAGK